MKSVPSLLFFRPMKKEPTVFPFGPIAEMIVVPKRPYRPGEKCLDKSTGEVVTILSCEPMKVSEVTVADLQKLGYFASLMQDPCDMADQIKDKFKDDWHKRHPGKEWCWRIFSEEVKS